MENFEKSFLKDKYWGKQEFRDVVEESTEKKKRLAEEGDFQIPQKPGEKIPHYLERLEQVTGRIDPRTGERGRLFLETSLYPKYVIKPENISDEYIKGILLGNFTEQRGYERDALKNEEIKQHILAQFKQETGQDFGDYQIPEEERERVRSMVVIDQRARLNQWFKYLTSEETRGIPAAFRYWAFAEMLKLGSYDEERKVFNRRTENTAASFPELDQQALSFVFDELQRKLNKEPSKLAFEDDTQKVRFKELLQKEDFGRLYAFMLDHINSLRLPTERLVITKGEWRQFPKGSYPRDLTSTIDGFNTKWCIAGEGYAQDYLNRSDVWIYFSEDADGSNSIPRACIVDSGEHGITEVRGIMSSEEAKQHLDSHITPVVAEKLKSMPGGEKWQNTMEDMKQLAKIHFKHLQNEPLNKEELIFLYEIDRLIQSSGYERDPRIEAIRKRRNPREDAPIVLGCKPEEISWSKDEINGKTKAYVGQLNEDIFDLIQERGIEQVYTSFPEGRVEIERDFEAGPITLEEFENRIKEYNRNIQDESLKLKIYDYARDMMGKPEFRTLKAPEQFTLIRLKVRALFSDERVHTTAEILGKEDDRDEQGRPAPFTSGQMTKLGLELCPPETGPCKRLKDLNQPMNEWYRIAMKPISDRYGYPFVFSLVRSLDGLWLYDYIACPFDEWYPAYGFVFRLRKKNLET